VNHAQSSKHSKTVNKTASRINADRVNNCNLDLRFFKDWLMTDCPFADHNPFDPF
jgi:hypothetical protein